MRIRDYGGMAETVARGEPGGCFLLCGTEQLQLSRLRSAARRRYCQDLGFEHVTMSVESTEPGSIARLLGEPSLFSPGRLLRFPEADRMPAAVRRELADAVRQGGLVDAILVESGETSLRHQFNASLEPFAATFVCWDPFERDMPGWCDLLAREKGLRLDSAARRTVLDWAAGSLSRLGDALERASLYASGGSLTAADAAALLAGVADPAVFDLASLVWAGRRGDALGCAWRLLDAGEEPVGILALVQRQWEMLEAARAVVAAGGGRREVEKALGTGQTAAAGLLSALSGGAPPAWRAAEALAGADHALKTGRDAYSVLAGLIYSLTGRG